MKCYNFYITFDEQRELVIIFNVPEVDTIRFFPLNSGAEPEESRRVEYVARAPVNSQRAGKCGKTKRVTVAPPLFARTAAAGRKEQRAQIARASANFN
jgi:hypothetical protein